VAGYSNLSITQITASNKTVTMEIRSSQLSAGKRYVRVAVTSAPRRTVRGRHSARRGGASEPASANDAAQVTERKVVS